MFKISVSIAINFYRSLRPDESPPLISIIQKFFVGRLVGEGEGLNVKQTRRVPCVDYNIRKFFVGRLVGEEDNGFIPPPPA